MLQELSIKNFAIIDDLHIGFANGLTILSGETGAGKSIIINAVNLLLGGRATSKQIRTGADTAEIEALFRIIPESKAAKAMAANGFQPENDLLIRRILSRNGKHSIHINGHLATAQMLNAITENLASISGQHAHQGLLKEDQHLMILDQFAKLIPLRNRVHDMYHDMLPMLQKYHSLKELQDRQTEQIRLLEFQKNEILTAAISPGEDAALEQEKNRLKHLEELYRIVQNAVARLYTDSGAVIETLGETGKELDRAAAIDPALSDTSERIGNAAILLEDMTSDLRTYLGTLDIEDNRLDTVESRLFELQRLKRKYGKTLEDVSAYLDTIHHDLQEIENLSDKIVETESDLKVLHQKLAASALTLSEKRCAAATVLSQRVVGELASLGMGQTEFSIRMETVPLKNATHPHLTINNAEIGEFGIDRAVFMITPNVGEAVKPLSDIVSGGELSRVVLALKAILAHTESVETVVFDEVDAGIGGRIAEVVGQKLFALSENYQTICITHLPQIAKFGNHHIHISKTVQNKRTVTNMAVLNEEERVTELARMLGGVTITPATLAHAREMLEQRSKNH